MTVSLPMYDRPELTEHHAALWALIRDDLRGQGLAVPERLDQSAEGPDFWLSDRMLFSQACGMPYRQLLHGKVTLVGTPDYSVEGCQAGYYNSVLIAKTGNFEGGLVDADGAVLACNSKMSQSGFAAPIVAARNTGIAFGGMVITGAHLASIAAIRTGTADVAAIDAVTWRNHRTYDTADGVSVIGHTPPTPGLPYIVSRTQNASQWFSAIERAIGLLPLSSRTALGLHGLVAIPARDYLSVDYD